MTISTSFCKVVFIGESGAGKTTLLHAMLNVKSDPQMTIGCTFRSYEIPNLSNPVVLHLWDTCGQERFRCLTNTYLRGCKIAVVVIDPQKDISAQLNAWIPEVKKHPSIKGSLHSAREAVAISENLKHCLEEPYLLIVINKIDTVSLENLELLKKKFENDNALFTSAKDKNGVAALLHILCEEGKKKSEYASIETVKLTPRSTTSSRCCY